MTDAEIDAPLGLAEIWPSWRVTIFFVQASTLPTLVIADLPKYEADTWMHKVAAGMRHGEMIEYQGWIIRPSEVAMAVREDQRI